VTGGSECNGGIAAFGQVCLVTGFLVTAFPSDRAGVIPGEASGWEHLGRRRGATRLPLVTQSDRWVSGYEACSCSPCRVALPPLELGPHLPSLVLRGLGV
jgi:hypothetical protein